MYSALLRDVLYSFYFIKKHINIQKYKKVKFSNKFRREKGVGVRGQLTVTCIAGGMSHTAARDL